MAYQIHIPLQTIVLLFHGMISKEELLGFIKKTREYGVTVEMDLSSRSLVESYLRDKNCLNKGIINLQFEYSEIEAILEQQGFRRVLKTEQLRDTQSLLRLNHGANFSVPGAGKTTTILAVHYILRSLKYINKLFVIAPINAFISWEDEVDEIFGSKKPNNI